MPEKALSEAPVDGPQGGQNVDLESLPDLPAATNHPIFQKLQLVTEMNFRSENPDIDDVHQISNETLLTKTKNESFVYGTCLIEFVKRVAKGVIPVEVMEANFSSQTIVADVLTALNLIVDTGRMKILKEEASDAGIGGIQRYNYECRDLEQIIQDIIDNGLLTVEELKRGIRNPDLNEFFRQKFAGKEPHKPSIIAQYYQLKPHGGQLHGDRKSRDALGRAHTIMDLSEIIAEVTRDEIAGQQTQVTAGAKTQADAEITFTDEENPTLRKGKVIPPIKPPVPPTAAESAELAEVVKLPAGVAEISMNGEEKFIPLMLEGEIYTIGSDPINDIVVKGDSAAKSESIHGMVFVRGGVVYIKAITAPMKLEREYFAEDANGSVVRKKCRDTGLVLTNAEREVDRGQLFFLMPKGKAFEETTALPCFSAIAGYSLQKKEIGEELKERFIRFTGLKADKLFQLLREKDEKVKKTLRDEVLVIERKLERIDEAVRQYVIAVLTPEERERIVLDANNGLSKLLDNSIETYFKRIARTLLKHVEDNRTVPSDIAISESFIRAHKNCRVEVERIEGLFGFAREYGIQVMPEERAQNLMAQVMEKAESRRKEIAAKIKEERRNATIQTEENKKRIADHAEKINAIRRKYKGVHLGDGEVLDENTQFPYVGSVIKITDRHGFVRVDPILINEITIGDHSANTHQIPPMNTAKFSTQDFMASITRDGDDLIMTWLGGSLNLSDTKAVLTSPTFPIEPGQEYKMASCRVVIEENHAYSLRALKQVCPDLARELIEVVFNMDETSEGQDEDALMNLEGLMDTGYVDRRFVADAMAFGMNALVESIMHWDRAREAEAGKGHQHNQIESIKEEPMPDVGIIASLRDFITEEMQRNPLQDAHYLRTLKMLLDVSGKNGLLPKYSKPGTMEFLKSQARRRASAYCEVDAEKNRMIEQDNAPFSLRSIGGKISAGSRKKHQLVLETLKMKASVGAVQIARFHEMGLLDLGNDVFDLPSASVDYCTDIREIVEMRSLLHKFEKGQITHEEIESLRQKSSGWNLSGILSADEIETDNHNMDMNLRDNDSVEYYIGKLAVAMGRKALRSAAMAQDPRRSVAVIAKLKNMGLLKDADLMQLPELPVENIRVILAELESNSRYLNEQDALKVESTREAHKEFSVLQKVAFRVDKAIVKAAREENLEVLVDEAGIVTDDILMHRMERLGVTLPAIEKIEGISEAEMKALNMVAQINYQRDWASICKEYRKLALELGELEVGKILACDDADYRMVIVNETVRKGLFTYDELGITAEQMRADVDGTRALTQARIREAKLKDIRDKYDGLMAPYQNSDIDDLSYLNAIKLNEITDPDEKHTATVWLGALSRAKIAGIIQSIDRNEDVAYLKMIAAGIIASGFDPSQEFSPEEVAKLGTGG
jgi:hypothetical protein